MAEVYSYNYRSKSEAFPQRVTEKKTFKDVDSTVASMVATVQGYYASGNFQEANAYILAHPELSDYMMTNVDINRILEDLYNLQIFALRRRQDIYLTDTAPLAAIDGDVWISDAEL